MYFYFAGLYFVRRRLIFSVPQLWYDRPTIMRRTSHIYETIVSQLWDAKFDLLFH